MNCFCYIILKDLKDIMLHIYIYIYMFMCIYIYIYVCIYIIKYHFHLLFKGRWDWTKWIFFSCVCWIQCNPDNGGCWTWGKGRQNHPEVADVVCNWQRWIFMGTPSWQDRWQPGSVLLIPMGNNMIIGWNEVDASYQDSLMARYSQPSHVQIE